MIRRTPRCTRSAAVLAVLALAVAACGGDDDGATDADVDVTDAPEPDTETTAATTSDSGADTTEPPAPETTEVAATDAPSETTAAGSAGEDVTGSVKVGMITTLSGGAAYLGEDIRDGFQLAFDRDGRIDLDLAVEDDTQDPATGQQLADGMLQDGVDVMTGIVFSNVAGAVVPQVLGEDTLYLSANAGPSNFAGADCDENYYAVAWQNDNPAEAMGQYVKDQGVESVVALAPNYQAGQDSINGFKRTFGDIEDEIFTELGATDYAQAIAQIRDADPDAVYFFYPGGMGISFVNQYVESGLEIPIYGPTFSFDENIVDAIGPAAIGLQNASFWAPDLDVPANVEFVEAFRDAYGHTPTTYAAQGYDTANLLISAIVANGGDPSDNAAMREALSAADFESVRGDFRFNTNNHPIQDWYLLTVTEGEGGDLTNTIGETILEDHEDAYVGECSLG